MKGIIFNLVEGFVVAEGGESAWDGLLDAAGLDGGYSSLADYPDEEQPPGSWWLPARHGGSAPTPEEAKRLDEEEQVRRAEKRRARAEEARARKG